MNGADAELLDAAEQLLDDIEAMAGRGSDEYGEFSNWRRHDSSEGVIISWPNLRISAARLRRTLKSWRRES